MGHGEDAHALMPHSRLEIFDRAGHFPFNDDPARFVALIEDFVAETEPAELAEETLQDLLRSRSG